MKNAIPCNYAVVRFLPYPEAGEFVNVGVVLHSPVTGFFDYRLEIKRTRRISGFFPELELSVYRDALKNCELELTRMRAEVGVHGHTADQMVLDPTVGVALFRELVRPRETVVRFSTGGTALVDAPNAFLDELFDRYVLRMFAKQSEYQEEIMRGRLTETLQAHKLITRYKPAQVGNEAYHVNFPFVYQPRIGLFARAIKPLNLGQDESTKIYDHGDEWINRIRRLRNTGCAPQRMLFPVHAPEKRGRCAAAFEEVCNELRGLDVEVVPEDDEKAITAFAGAVEKDEHTLLLPFDE